MNFSRYSGPKLVGERTVLRKEDSGYPEALRAIPNPPEELYVLGNPEALREGLAVVGARKATPYGLGCARKFSLMAAERGVVIISGGARGCDAAAHRAALAAGGATVVFLGGGCDQIYPAEHAGLFQEIVDSGGAVVSEHDWAFPPLPYAFRERNRLIAGLARATLIVEAGLPSGTFSTADEALAAGREVLAVPGSIASPSSRGSNRLILQGAMPVIDDESFLDALFAIFGCLKQESVAQGKGKSRARTAEEKLARMPLVRAVRAQPYHSEEIHALARSIHRGKNPHAWALQQLSEAELAGLVAHYPDGRWGPVVSVG